MKIKLLIEGGDMKPGPAIAQQLGPLGVNIGKVISIKQNKEDVKQVGKDKECGIMADVKIDFTIGDMLIFLSSKK